MLADTVVRQSLKEIGDELMTSDVLRPVAAVVSDKAVQVARSSLSTAAACPPAVCTELTKYIVMNAVDIARSCARRAATIDGDGSRAVDRRASASNLVDAFVDRLSSEVYGSLSDAAARRPTPDAVVAASRWIDDDLRRRCLQASTSGRPPGQSGVDPFSEVLVNLAVHDRLGDLQKNFIDGREMIELATCVLKSHVQSHGAAHHHQTPRDLDKTTDVGEIDNNAQRICTLCTVKYTY